MPTSRLRLPLFLLTLTSSLALTACGGGSSASYQGSIVTGRVLMGPQASGDTSGGPVSGATVCSYAFVDGGAAYTITSTVTPYTYSKTTAACTTTASDGSFTLDLLSGYYGPILLQATGGSYAFNGQSYTLNALTSTNLGLAVSASDAFIATGTTLQAVVSVGGGGTVTSNITPLTTFAVARSNPTSGFTVATYQTNLNAIATQFGISGVGDLATAVPGNDTYGVAMSGVEKYIATMTPAPGTNTDDPYSAYLLNWTYLSQVSGYYNTINGTSLSFN